jgi:hypothetical protein
VTANELAEQKQNEINEYRAAKAAMKSAQNVVGKFSETDYADDDMSAALLAQSAANVAFQRINQKLWSAVEKNIGRGGREGGKFFEIADGKAN